ncbi:MAG: leucine-rich repeat domain-containing protein, partial [Algicola sp.]|nr:leucine-rich repeat domain-containing protein [Algicola sp.]
TIKSGQTTGILILTTNQDQIVEDPQSIIINVVAVSGGNAYQSGAQQVSITLFDGELDTDLDGIANSLDTDDDNDGIPDTSDDFPLDPTQSVFTLITQLTVDDERFSACITQTAATNNWTQISEIVSLDCSSQGISDLNNIERFTQLKSLKLSDNALTDIDPLTNLAQLTELDLSQNNLVQSTALAGLSALTELNLANNTIDNANALSHLTQLKHLSLSNNLIGDIDALGGIASLDEIDLNNNRIAQVTGLFNLTQTAKIHLLENNNIDCSELDSLIGTLTDSQISRPTHCVGSGTFIADVPFANDNLRQCVIAAASNNDWHNVDEVTQLSCASSDIDDLTGLEYFVHLTSLTLNDNQLTDLTPLNALIELTYLDVRKNAVTDIQGLNRLLELTTLKLAKNNLDNIQVMANFSQLTFLSLAGNKVTDSQLNALAKLTQLSALYLRDNLITDIQPLTDLVNLTRLYLSRNAISDISSLAGFDQLIKVELNDNNISDISALFGLSFATNIQLVGNEGIPCVDINALELTLEQARIVRPASCINIAQINFTDTALELCVVEAALQNAWITANQVTRLSCIDKSVKSLDGIGTLSALEFVDLGQNEIVNISTLFRLSKANDINLFGNDGIKCADLDSLAIAAEGRVLTRPDVCLN